MHSPQVAHQLYLLISVLGPLQVRLGTALISRFEFERVRALLLYLAVEGVSHERAWLAYMFWPDAPLKTGLQNVRQTLAALKRTLQDPQRTVPYLTTTPTTIGLNSDAGYILDLNEFSTLMGETERHAHRRLESCAACMTRLEQAVALYRGDFARGVAVDSEPFEEWILQKQEHLHSQAIRALGTLTTHYLQQRHYGKAIQTARRLLTLDPLSDVGHHQLIQALAGDNQRHAALKQCLSYQTMLQDELMVPLPPQTARLQRQLTSETWEPLMLGQSPRHNLPKPLNPFVGYEKERATIHERLANADCRLLTLSGIAGVGKTRLAIETAWAELANFRDGVFFVELETVHPGGVLAAIADVLLPSPDPACPVGHQLRQHLRNKELLLVLDGFDHLIQSDAASLRLLLRDAPRVQIIVTSCERLKMQGETCVDISGLEFPTRAGGRHLESYDAVRFFVQCASRWQPDFSLDNADDCEAVLHMCQNVGGNPCALDLYAQVARFFPLGQIINELDRFSDWGEALNRDLPARHRSLKAMFYALWRRLSQEERRALIPLAVFSDSFTLEAGQVISQASPTVLLSLQAKSCLTVTTLPAPVVQAGGADVTTALSTRYHLPELLRFYLRQTLEREPTLLKRIGRNHALSYMSMLNQCVEALANGRAQEAQLATIHMERANIQQAMAWAAQEAAHVVKAQIEQDLTLAHVYESRLQNAGWEGLERYIPPLHHEWA